MKTVPIQIEDKVDELVVCLDKDIEHIQESLSNLDKLRSLVIKHDDIALGQLLESIRAQSDNYKEHETKRQSIREELAKSLNFNVNEMTLSKLEEFVSEERKSRIVWCKTKLSELIRELKKENMGTALFLADCARFNKLILKSIFNFGNGEAVFYNANGTAKERNEQAFVNLQF
jgi:uncharacterized protein YpuA (DUF1002 family)